MATSGISPTYQNSSDTVAYVETAKASHTRGLRHWGHIPIVFGYGSKNQKQTHLAAHVDQREQPGAGDREQRHRLGRSG